MSAEPGTTRDFLEAAHAFEATIDGRQLRSLLHGEPRLRAVAIENQDPATWRDRALAEQDPQAARTALLSGQREEQHECERVGRDLQIEIHRAVDHQRQDAHH